MHVIATAGHVDHGKSTLVRALTGMEPDRWAEERRRGMTIDLGFAWTNLPSGEVMSFVDVPGHQRFIANMLAGLGPAPAVLFVVAADEGWRRQSQEHLAAVDALRLRRGLLAITRSDLADPAQAREQALAAIAGTSLGHVNSVLVSGRTGAGIDGLKVALDELLVTCPKPDHAGAVRLWVDRSFTVRGAGTVVTGTLSAGRLAVGDTLELDGRPVTIRGLQSLGENVSQAQAISRVAVNLRGVAAMQVTRGQALLTPGTCHPSAVVDVQIDGDLPAQLVVHVGTAAVAAHARHLGGGYARLRLDRSLALLVGDRLILREPAQQVVLGGAVVLDVQPPAIDRRGAALTRGRDLARPLDDLASRVARQGAIRADHSFPLPPQVRSVGGWLISLERWSQWLDLLTETVALQRASDPLSAGVSESHIHRLLSLPDHQLLAALVDDAGLARVAGRVRQRGAREHLGPAEPGIRALEARLLDHPFAAPDAPELARLGLGTRELAAAELDGRLIRCSNIVLLPSAPDLAWRRLSGLPQPFTLSQARQVMETSRRVALPVLEHLDRHGRTWRLEGGLRATVRPTTDQDP